VTLLIAKTHWAATINTIDRTKGRHTRKRSTWKIALALSEQAISDQRSARVVKSTSQSYYGRVLVVKRRTDMNDIAGSL
jgi:hypothetical protein